MDYLLTYKSRFLSAPPIYPKVLAVYSSCLTAHYSSISTKKLKKFANKHYLSTGIYSVNKRGLSLDGNMLSLLNINSPTFCNTRQNRLLLIACNFSLVLQTPLVFTYNGPQSKPIVIRNSHFN